MNCKYFVLFSFVLLWFDLQSQVVSTFENDTISFFQIYKSDTSGAKTIENGAFTYSILECLKQNEGKELKVNTLKQYVEKRVEEITNGKQKPTSRQETMEVDWGVR